VLACSWWLAAAEQVREEAADAAAVALGTRIVVMGGGARHGPALLLLDVHVAAVEPALHQLVHRALRLGPVVECTDHCQHGCSLKIAG
jgi:hypothetical protein